jgi:alpha-glucosidase
MWSGDIGSNLTTLASHLNAQLHMSMSGIDYFGSDIGGFIRDVARGDLSETYTQWFADGMAVDIPGRVHTMNTRNDRETAPDRVGELASNLANVRRRYELVPYVYSLAHRAFATGDPVFPPLVWAFQEDPEARTLGGTKMIGDAVLVALVAKDGARTVDVYLPRGASWVELDGDRRHDGGQWLRGVPLRDAAGVLRLPMFARAGAILPLAYVDDDTWNVLGQRAHGDRHDELRARVFSGTVATQFELAEDDGVTIAYQHGELRRTTIEQHSDLAARAETVSIAAARGSYAGAPARRDAVIDVVLEPGVQPRAVAVDGKAVARAPTLDACEHTARSWYPVAGARVRVHAGEAAVTSARTIVVSW